MTVVTVTLNPCIDKAFSVDRMVPDRKLAGERLREDPGGGGINVARVITRLGGDALALWSAGGETGRRLARLLDAEGVPHEAIPIEGQVRENLIITDASTGEQYRFGMPGPMLSEAELARWAARLGRLPASVHYVAFSGSLPGNLLAQSFEALLRSVPNGIRIVVDSKREALRQALETGVYLVKPNLHELGEVWEQELAGDDQVEQAAREIIEAGGAEVVLVSLGRGGALLVTANRIERFASPPVPIRSKVGAGDSMVGAVLAALDQGRPLEDAARLGVAAGAAAVMSEGTELCRREDTERLYRSVCSERQSPSMPRQLSTR